MQAADDTEQAIQAVVKALDFLDGLPVDQRVDAINRIRAAVHAKSPMASEPVDFVAWLPANRVERNHYNPNATASREMDLLRQSIEADGFTMPIVVFEEPDHYTIVDGFHRSRVGRECQTVRERTHGYLPVSMINKTALAGFPGGVPTGRLVAAADAMYDQFEADLKAVSGGLKSRQDVHLERGGNYFATIDRLAEEEAYAKQKGVCLVYAPANVITSQTDDGAVPSAPSRGAQE
jgi:hypothetical protein